MELEKHAITQTYLLLKRIHYFIFYPKIPWATDSREVVITR